MKKRIWMYFGFLIFIMAGLILIVINGQSFSQSNDSQNSFAVIELFTSEGCSSCPPADRLLGEIVKDARENDQSIYALSFHVDYWDYIGWKDPFASSAYSQRQQDYAKAFRSSRIYTPQMVVNGRQEFVGSNKAKARTAIAEALGKTAALNIEIRDVTQTENTVSVQYSVSQAIPNAVLNIALVERGLVTQVKRGENSGRTLQHENVVRSFDVITPGNSSPLRNSVTMEIPEGVNRDNCSIIIYVQNDSSMEILGATGVDI